jgi:hypothetical protein
VLNDILVLMKLLEIKYVLGPSGLVPRVREYLRNDCHLEIEQT